MESAEISSLSWDARGLIPTVVQDVSTGEVLMVAWMNEESLRLTLKTGETWFFSRSRQKLWHKGEESGHVQHVKRIFVDCDADTLVVQVVPEGPACHTNNRSCFFRSLAGWDNEKIAGSLSILTDLFNEIKDRRIHPVEKSYTHYLQTVGKNKIDKKVGEEASEVIIADQHEDKKEITEESCDLLYHLMVLWENAGLELSDIMRCLEERDQVKGNQKEVGHKDKVF
jgi:phosphoribosyl-ATP pyrophosphohydrolase/phosphoribosyl-AMP cyclohydrolase